MEPQIPGSSFIPKKPAQKTQVDKPRRPSQDSIFVLLAGLAFLISGLLAGGVFFYEKYHQSLLKKENDALSQEILKFTLADLADLYELNSWIEITKKLLDRHVAVTRVLEELELFTSDQVQYISFNFNQTKKGNQAEGDAHLTDLTLTGKTSQFNNLLVQREALNNSNILKDVQLVSVSFSNSEDNSSSADNRVVSFSLSSAIPSNVIQYTGQHQNAPNRPAITNLGSATEDNLPPLASDFPPEGTDETDIPDTGNTDSSNSAPTDETGETG